KKEFVIIACMGVQAILVKDTGSLYKRIALITDVPIDQIVERIKNIKKRRIEARKKNEETIQFAKNDDMIECLPAFFEGVELYHKPWLYPGVFFAGAVPKTQDIIATASVIRPKKVFDNEEFVDMDNFRGVYNEEKLKQYFDSLREVLRNSKSPVA